MWIICKDNGYEGLAEPFYVCGIRKDADALLEFIKDISYSGCWTIVESKSWPMTLGK